MQELNPRYNWLPIPSLGGKYELNGKGKARNARTKRLLKPAKHHDGLAYTFYCNGKHIRRTVQQLMWEVHGVLPLKKNARSSRNHKQRRRKILLRYNEVCRQILKPAYLFILAYHIPQYGQAR